LDGLKVSDVDVLAALQEDLYRIGDLQALRYDKSKTDLWPDDFLAHLYHRCRESRRRSGDGVLTATFGGNPASDFNSIVTYLAQRPVLLILGKWVDGKFHEMGFAFPTVSMGGPNTEKSLIAGYAFFKDSWGTEDQQILTMLGLAYLFKEFDLQAIIGNRYRDNVLTAKFMSRFGFKDCGEIPCFQLRGTKLVSMIVSSLLRADFEGYVSEFLVNEWRKAQVPQESAGDAGAPEEKLTITEVEPEPAKEQPYLPLSWL
jgi:hypothetical protein